MPIVEHVPPDVPAATSGHQSAIPAGELSGFPGVGAAMTRARNARRRIRSTRRGPRG
jgi:hypothetical protein